MAESLSISCLKDELCNWLEKAQLWMQSQHRCHAVENKELERLIIFLQDLYEYCNSKNSVSDLVDEMPQAGQMLGRLASLPFILANAGCSTALVKCLSYYIFSASKQSPLEVHAEQWALKQLKRIISLQAPRQLRHLQDITKASNCEMANLLLQKEEDTIGSLRFRNGNNTSDAPERLVFACLACLYAYEGQLKFGELLSVLLKELSKWSNSPGGIMIYKHILSLQKKRKCSDIFLPFEAQVSVWLNYGPALEQTVMALVHYTCTMPYLVLADLRLALQKTRLAQACAEHTLLYNSVYTILFALLHRCHGHNHLLQLIFILSGEMQVFQVEYSTLRWPAEVKPLYHLLNIPLTGLSVTQCNQHVSEVGQMLSTVLADGVTSNRQLWFLVLPHSDYYWMSHVIALREEAHFVRSCSMTICFFGQGHLASTNTVCEAVMYLRRLSSKHNISALDYSINTDSQDELSDVSSRPLTLQICHSFLLFLLLFPVAFDLQRSILRWVTSSEDYVLWLNKVLDVAQVILNIKCSWLGEMLDMSIIQQLTETVEKSVYDINHECDLLVEKDNVNNNDIQTNIHRTKIRKLIEISGKLQNG